jgi:hypothetical protein
VDLREALGGDASVLVAEKLARRGIGWYLSRHDEPSSYPFEAPRGPIVAITDEYAIEVAIAPHDWAAGRDPQLDTAVRLALQALEQRTPPAPPTV